MCIRDRNGEERWVRNVVIRGEIEDSEYAMIFLRDITEAKVESARHLQMAEMCIRDSIITMNTIATPNAAKHSFPLGFIGSSDNFPVIVYL